LIFIDVVKREPGTTKLKATVKFEYGN